MNVITRGVRNAFRNATRTVSIVLILSLSIGLGMIMLIANQAVEAKITDTLSSIGNTVRIHPAGYAAQNSINNALTDEQLARVAKVPHVEGVSGMLRGTLQTKGTTGEITPPGGGGNVRTQQGAGAQETASTSLKMPFKLECDEGACMSGEMGLKNADGSTPTFPDNFSLPIPVAGSTNPTDPAAISASTIKITSGDAFDGTKAVNEAIISQEMAQKNNLKVGDTFTAFDETFTVAAIFQADTRAGNSTVLIPLPTLQRLTDREKLITSAVATVDSLENLESATKAIQEIFGSSADVTSQLEQAEQALKPLRTVQSISLYSLVGSVVAGAVIILLTMIMIVRERKREIGVLKAIGFSNLRIMLQFMNEALTLTLMAAVVGILIGAVAGGPVTTTLTQVGGEGEGPGLRFSGGAFDSVRDVQAVVGWDILLYGVAAAVLIAVIGSALASFFIAKVRPAEVLRSE